MPAREPFTHLCQQLAKGRHVGRADLHLHTTASDGTYTPAQVVEFARRCGLAAIAVTDHDTFAGVGPAQAASGRDVEVIAGVEITAEYQGRELHLLGYFVDPYYPPLVVALAEIRQARVERFAAMVERLRRLGVSVTVDEIDADAVGRRHLAELLVRQGKAGSIREAFQRWLRDGTEVVVAKKRLPVAEAIGLVRAAGGVATWAHPTYDGSTPGRVAELAAVGLGGIEVEYPETTNSHKNALRALASRHDLAVTGGSDCHGPGKREVGACTISDDQLEQLRRRRGGACSAPCSTSSSKG